MPFTIAVRELCEFTVKAGDLDLRFTPAPTAEEGREGHRVVAARRGAGYQAERALTAEFGALRLRGRCDGFDPARRLLEEVKTHRGDVARIPDNQRALHWAQAMLYGAMLCAEDDLDELDIAVVYFEIGDQTETPVTRHFTRQELQEFFTEHCTRFLRWAEQELAHRDARDAALAALQFPYPEFRHGQRALAAGVYRAARDGHCLLAQAPTGIGKTMGTLFPLLKAMPTQQLDRVFFLTAKTPGRALALEAARKLPVGWAGAACPRATAEAAPADTPRPATDAGRVGNDRGPLPTLHAPGEFVGRGSSRLKPLLRPQEVPVGRKPRKPTASLLLVGAASAANPTGDATSTLGNEAEHPFAPGESKISAAPLLREHEGKNDSSPLSGREQVFVGAASAANPTTPVPTTPNQSHSLAPPTDAAAASVSTTATPPPTLRVLELTARDKACVHPDKECHGDSCPLAQGFYDRLPAARAAAVRQGFLDQPALQQLAAAHAVCPYYLAQELARWSDVVVGDYNYFFDVSALLHALAQSRDWKVAVLADEAHNLVDRAREMYSAELQSAQLAALRKSAPAALKRPLGRLQKAWDELQQDALEDDAEGEPRTNKKSVTAIDSAVGWAFAECPRDTHVQTRGQASLPTLRGPQEESNGVSNAADDARISAAPRRRGPDQQAKAASPRNRDDRILDALPAAFTGALQGAIAKIADYQAEHPLEVNPELLRFYFDALHFQNLLESLVLPLPASCGSGFGPTAVPGSDAVVGLEPDLQAANTGTSPHSFIDISSKKGAESFSRSRKSDAATFAARNDSAPFSVLRIRNVIPAPHLVPRIAACHTLTLFSATLTPPALYRNLLGLPAATQWLDVPSPFDARQLDVHLVPHISTRYRDREASLVPIAELMAAQYCRRPGNYLAFFSSHDYLQKALATFRERHPDIPLREQSREMSEAARAEFLQGFGETTRGIAFAVLGGAFGEGIDLPGERLVGAFIATLGLPQVNAQNEKTRELLRARFGAGYDYTYLYPGLQKVVQAAGRVIRSREDRGVVYLIDDRFTQAKVRALLPAWWRPVREGPTRR